MIIGLMWVSAPLFFRKEIDPLYAQMPLMFILVILLILLMHGIVLAIIGRSLGRPYVGGKKRGTRSGIPPPSLPFVLIWSFIAILTLGAGASFYMSEPTLAIVLWVTGAITLISALSFLLIPANVHAENAEGDIVFKPNPIRMAPQAIYFWSSSIIYGGFFLIAGSILEPTATIGSIISMGTGAGWLFGALILSLVALFRMGIESDEQSITKTRLLVPSENFTQISGNPEIKNELSQILYQIDTSQKSMGSAPNGILLVGPSAVGRSLFARALAGEYKRPLYNFSLNSLLALDPATLDNFWKGFLFKIKPFNPLVIVIDDYGKTLEEAAQSHPQGLRNITHFLSKLSKNRTHALIASAETINGIPQSFLTPPIIHWTVNVPLPDLELRKNLLSRFLIEESRKNELLPGKIPLLTQEMIPEIDLDKLSGLMEGFAPEDIREVVNHSTQYAKKLRRSLRQLDIDVSIRRKAQNWKDPTAGPMEIVRSRLTDESVGPFLVNRAEELFSNRQKKNPESILIIGRNRKTRKMIADRLAKQVGYSFMSPPDEKKLDGNEFRNIMLKSRKHRPSMVFIDPLDDLFPKVQLSNYGYHGELYNQKVMELSQANEDKKIWLVAGAEDINRVDPFITRRFTSLLDLSELGRSLFSELEEFALGKILEGVPADQIDFSPFAEKTSGKENTLSSQVIQEKPSLRLAMDPPSAEAIPGFPGRPGTQDEIRTVLEAGAFNIKSGGSALLGAFLFAGPRGTGKRQAAHAIAKYLSPTKENLIVRDMGLYSERLFASMFLQRPLGSKNASPLPEGLRTLLSQNPESVIYLDNIEQAHPSVWDFLPTYLKDGVIDVGGKPLVANRSLMILSTSLFSGDEMDQLSQGNRSGSILDKLSNKNRRLAFLPVFDREVLETLDLIVPFPTYSDQDITDIARRTVYDILDRFIKAHPMNGSLEVDPEIPAFITFQVDPASTTSGELIRKIQTMMIPVLRDLEASQTSSTHEIALRISIVGNRLELTLPSDSQTEQSPVSQTISIPSETASE
jgi:ATP-dependent Clp protease ATP-binding subunit ClpB/ATP-dependent Clp protease ATP-binding subunit ClpC